MSYQLYRNTSLGQTLQDSLYELIQTMQIPPRLATSVLLQFDKTINEALSTRVSDKVVFHSEKLVFYRFCDNVWTFLLKKVEMRVGQREIGSFDRVKIVACDAKASTVTPATTANAAKAKKGQGGDSKQVKALSRAMGTSTLEANLYDS